MMLQSRFFEIQNMEKFEETFEKEDESYEFVSGWKCLKCGGSTLWKDHIFVNDNSLQLNHEKINHKDDCPIAIMKKEEELSMGAY